MTTLLQKALKTAERLPEQDQNKLAELILEVIEDEQLWQNSFNKSIPQLEKLGQEALKEFNENKTEPLDLKQLYSVTTKRFREAYKNLPSKIKDAAKKSFEMWKKNPNHPGLRFKKILSNKEFYSVTISKGWRALGTKNENNMIWFWIGSHSDYDKLIENL